MQSQGLDWGQIISAMAEKWKESVINELVFQLDQENIGKIEERINTASEGHTSQHLSIGYHIDIH